METINKGILMKKTLRSIVVLGALCCGALHATFQFRSPLSLEDRGYMHWLLTPSVDAWWYGMMPSEKKHTDWNIHAWGAGYIRKACEAFYDPCNPNKVTRDTTSLSQLFFGKAVFRGEDIFAGGTFAGEPTTTQVLVNAINPYLAFARISPVFDYNETGAHIGVDFNRYVGNNDRYHIGGRAYIPFKMIEIEQDGSFDLEETLDDVFITRIVTLSEGATPDQTEYAMRFDFLNTLVFQTVTTPSQVLTPSPVVRYDVPVAGEISIMSAQITANSSAQTNTAPAAYVTKSDTGAAPIPPFKRNPDQINAVLPASGVGVNGESYLMKTGVDYKNNLRNDREAQGTLFVVPRSNPSTGELTPDAQTILTQVQTIVDRDLAVSEPVSSFFADNGINLFAHECIIGVGDLAMEVYGGVGHYADWFVDGIFGLSFPTGKRQKDINRIYYQTTGNNGHVDVRLELDAGWRPREWFAFEIRPTFIHSCKRTERRAAPFEGATVVNIGPEIEVSNSWNSFVLRTDFSFFHPHNPDLGFTLGYELFVKGEDKISLKDCQETATDLLGRRNQPLSVCNYEKGTNSLSNKLRGEIFHRWNYFELFAGGTQIVSGRHIMKETQGHIGLALYF